MPTQPIFIIGLPGSGKSTLAAQLADSLPNVLWSSDPSDFEQFKQDCINSVNFDYFLVDSTYLCEEDARSLLISGLEDLNPQILMPLWICFENNIDPCVKNVNMRGDSLEVLDDIYFFSENYNFPVNNYKVPVYSPESPTKIYLDNLLQHIKD